MALFVKHLLDHLSDTLGGGELPVGLDTMNIINQAGEHLHSMHPWRWAQGRSTLLSLRGTVTGTGGTWTNGTSTLTKTGAFTDYTFLAGDEIQITGGTGVTTGFYEVASRVSANAITLAASISAGAPTDVAFTLQPYSIDLPDDLRDIISIRGTENTERHVSLTSLSEVLRAREATGPNDTHWYAAVAYVGTPPTPILEIGPGAGSNEAGALRLFYRARWARLSMDSTSVAVPEFIEALLIQLVRAFGRGYVREDQGTLAFRLAEIRDSPLYTAAVQSDGNIQPTYGKLRGGGATIWRRGRSRDFNETIYRIAGPS